MTPLVLHLDKQDEIELDTLALLTQQEPEEIARMALREYIKTHPIRTIRAMAGDRAGPDGTDAADADSRRLQRNLAKARLASAGLRPVTLIFNGEAITDGLEYQKKIREEW